MPIRFNQLSSAPARALQIYLVLIGCAANLQVITYGRLAERVGLLTPTWLFASLDRLAEWCLQEGLPPSHHSLSPRTPEPPTAAIACRWRISRPNKTEPANSIGTRSSPRR